MILLVNAHQKVDVLILLLPRLKSSLVGALWFPIQLMSDDEFYVASPIDVLVLQHAPHCLMIAYCSPYRASHSLRPMFD